MNRKIILLPLASFLVLGLGGCGKSSSPVSSSEPVASSEPTSSSTESSTTPPVVNVDEIKNITKLGDYTIKATIVAVSDNSVLLDDGTGRISYFKKGGCGDYKVGDAYKVVGTIAAANYRYGNFQFTDTATFTKLDASKAPAIDKTATAYDAAKFDTWFAAMTAETSSDNKWADGKTVKGLTPTQRPLVTMRVKAAVSGGYYNYSVDGSTHGGGFTLPSSMTIENDKYYDVTGYLYEVVSQKYGYLWATAATEYVPDVVITGAEGAKTVKVGATLQLTATLKDTADSVASWADDGEGKVATVSATGLVTGVASGTAVITATTAAGKTGSIEIAVSASYKLSELPGLTKGSAFESKGVYMGMNDLETSAGVRQSIFVADGAAWYQLYTVSKTLIPDGLVAGTTVLSFAGTTADFTASETGSITTPEATVTKIEVVTDNAVTAGTPLAINKDNAAYALVAADVNKEAVIADAVVKSVSANSYGNLTIVFTVGEGTTEYTIYLDSRYTDVTVDALAKLAAGSEFSCKTFVGANKAALRFIYVMDLVVAAAADPTALTIQGAKAATTVEAGKTLQMEIATIAPSNGDRSVTWVVANKDTSVTTPLATIDAATGILTATTAGVVVVTATSTKVAAVTASVEITITPAPTNLETIDFSDGKNAMGIPAAASTTDSEVTYDSVTYVVNNTYATGYKGTNYMMIKSGGYLYNKTAMPHKIASIAVTGTSGSSTTAEYHCTFGTTVLAGSLTTGTVAHTGTGDWTAANSATDSEFFNISLATKNGQLVTIVINYIA